MDTGLEYARAVKNVLSPAVYRLNDFRKKVGQIPTAELTPIILILHQNSLSVVVFADPSTPQILEMHDVLPGSR